MLEATTRKVLYEKHILSKRYPGLAGYLEVQEQILRELDELQPGKTCPNPLQTDIWIVDYSVDGEKEGLLHSRTLIFLLSKGSFRHDHYNEI